MKLKLKQFPLLLCLVLLASPAFAQVIHNEAVDGDLSDSGAVPMLFALSLGTNTIEGTLGPDAGGSGATNGNDADFFTFTLGAGQSITSFTTTRSGPGSQSFVGYSNSSSIASTTTTDLTGGNLFGDGFLNSTAITAIPTTFGPGDHTFVFQEIGGGPVDYSASFEVVSTVPEPSSAVLLSGLAMCGFIRRRRK